MTDRKSAGDCSEKTTKHVKIYSLKLYSLQTLQEKIISERKILLKYYQRKILINKRSIEQEKYIWKPECYKPSKEYVCTCI